MKKKSISATAKGYCIKYDPREVLSEFLEYIQTHHKSDHAVYLLARKYAKSPRTIYRILEAARTS